MVNDGKVFGLECVDLQCDATISGADMEALLDDETLVKYGRFKMMREEPGARECPKCKHMNIGRPEYLAMKCDACKFL